MQQKNIKLSIYIKDKAKEIGMSNKSISKKLKEGSSGAYLAGIHHGRHIPCEKDLIAIADFFNDDANFIIFKARKVPIAIQNMIFDNEDIQKYLIERLNSLKNV